MKRMNRGILMCGLAMSAIVPARAQTDANAGEAVSLLSVTSGGDRFPLSVKLKDLNKDWRRIAIAVQGESNPMAIFGLGGAANDVYYTDNRMVRLGTETFIIAYREAAAPVDFQAMMRGQGAAKPPEVLSGETTLTLALLNLRSVSSLKNIAPFDLKTEIARRNTEIEDAKQKMAQINPQNAQAQEKATDASSNSNLKQLGLGIIQYAQDFDDTFPPLDDAAAMKKAIMPYVKNEAVFVHPSSKEAYQPNASLSGKKLASLAEPASRVLAYEASPGTDGRRGVLYADGHVKRESETEWPAIKKASQVP